jgi:hypothetical protein
VGQAGAYDLVDCRGEIPTWTKGAHKLEMSEANAPTNSVCDFAISFDPAGQKIERISMTAGPE